MKNSILDQIYAGYEKNVKKEDCSFQINLQIFYRLFFFIGITSFLKIHQKQFYRN